MADGGGVGRVEGTNFVRSQFGDAVAVGFEVVDEEDVLDVEGLRESVRVDTPRKVGELHAASANGAGETEAGGGDLALCAGIVGKEAMDDGVEAGELVGRKLLVANAAKLAVFEAVQREVNFGAAYVASKDHLFKLQRARIL
jgi:hypothetical protein